MRKVIEVAHLSSTRDLRSLILEKAVEFARGGEVELVLAWPALSRETIEQVWQDALNVLAPRLRTRLSLRLAEPRSRTLPSRRVSARSLSYEILRWLLNRILNNQPGPFQPKQIQEEIGASAPPVRRILRDLVAAGVLVEGGRGAVSAGRPPGATWRDWLASHGEAPPVYAFSYPAIVANRTPELLLRKALRVASSENFPVRVSGVQAARHCFPRIDLLGSTRLDLLYHAPRQADVHAFVAKIDPLLEENPHRFSSAAITITASYAPDPDMWQSERRDRVAGIGDIVLALEDARLYELAHQVARGRASWRK